MCYFGAYGLYTNNIYTYSMYYDEFLWWIFVIDLTNFCDKFDQFLWHCSKAAEMKKKNAFEINWPLEASFDLKTGGGGAMSIKIKLFKPIYYALEVSKRLTFRNNLHG